MLPKHIEQKCFGQKTGQNPEEEFSIKEEYSEKFKYNELFLQPSLTKFQIFYSGKLASFSCKPTTILSVIQPPHVPV